MDDGRLALGEIQRGNFLRKRITIRRARVAHRQIYVLSKRAAGETNQKYLQQRVHGSNVLARKQRRGFANRLTRLQSAPGRGVEFVRRAGQAKLRVNFCRGAGQKRPEQNRENAAGFGQIVEHFIEPLRLRRIFGEGERLCLIYILIRSVDEAPDALQCGLKLALLEQRARFVRRLRCVRREFIRARGHDAVAITLEHRERAVDEIAEAVREFGLITRAKTGVGPVAVRPDVKFTQDVKTKSVQAPFVDDRNRVNDVAGALGDFGPVLLPPAVDEDLFRQRQAHRLEHDRPIDRVKFYNVLADDMNVRRPKLKFRMRKSDARVIHQRVEPDVGDEFLVEGQGNAPVQPRQRTRDAQVFERVVFEKAKHFVAAIRRRDEIRVRLDVINQPLLLRAELEVVVVFFQLDDFAITRGKLAIGQAVFFREKRFFLRRIKSRVARSEERRVGKELRERGLDKFLVARLRGADKIVIRRSEE